jgi:hypothetical protein
MDALMLVDAMQKRPDAMATYNLDCKEQVRTVLASALCCLGPWQLTAVVWFNLFLLDSWAEHTEHLTSQPTLSYMSHLSMEVGHIFQQCVLWHLSHACVSLTVFFLHMHLVLQWPVEQHQQLSSLQNSCLLAASASSGQLHLRRLSSSPGRTRDAAAAGQVRGKFSSADMMHALHVSAHYLACELFTIASCQYANAVSAAPLQFFGMALLLH